MVVTSKSISGQVCVASQSNCPIFDLIDFSVEDDGESIILCLAMVIGSNVCAYSWFKLIQSPSCDKHKPKYLKESQNSFPTWRIFLKGLCPYSRKSFTCTTKIPIKSCESYQKNTVPPSIFTKVYFTFSYHFKDASTNP